MNLNSSELSKIADGFSAITIGGLNVTGAVDIDTVSFSDPITIAGGSIDVESLNAASNDVDLIATIGAITNAPSVTNVTGGNVRLAGNTTPGQSPGVLQVVGNYRAGNTDLTLEFGGNTPGNTSTNHDQVAVTGSVSIDSSVALNMSSLNGFVPIIGDNFVIIDNDGADPVTGTFLGLPEGANIRNFLGTGLTAVISYAGGSGGNDVVINLESTDFGDAPAPYPTLTADNGAVHLAAGPRLGDERDIELNGQPSPQADGDDNVGVDDEDGVMFGSIDTSQSMAAVNIDLQNIASAVIDAWVDFDGDGIWQSDEKILNGVVASNVPGFETFNFPINADAVRGDTFARVRVSTLGSSDPTGFAADGEVEDHVVTIVASPSVESHAINGGDVQRSNVTEVEVTFDQEVTAPATAFEIIQRGSGTVLDTLQVSTLVNGDGKTVALLTFGTGGNLVQNRPNGGNSLVDGNFQLTIDAAQIAPVGGGSNMASDFVLGDEAVDNFFRYYSDHDGDRDSDSTDLPQFGMTFRKTFPDPLFNDVFDADGDLDVDGTDLVPFGMNFRGRMDFI